MIIGGNLTRRDMLLTSEEQQKGGEELARGRRGKGGTLHKGILSSKKSLVPR